MQSFPGVLCVHNNYICVYTHMQAHTYICTSHPILLQAAANVPEGLNKIS